MIAEQAHTNGTGHAAPARGELRSLNVIPGGETIAGVNPWAPTARVPGHATLFAVTVLLPTTTAAALRDQTADVRAELEATRAGFCDAPEFERAVRLRARLAEATDRAAEARQRGELALTQAQRQLAEGLDPTEAEASYRQACADRDVFEARAATLRALLGSAQAGAEDMARRRLRTLLDGKAAEIDSRLAAEGAELEGELLDVLGRLLPRLMAIAQASALVRAERGPLEGPSLAAQLAAELPEAPPAGAAAV